MVLFRRVIFNREPPEDDAVSHLKMINSYVENEDNLKTKITVFQNEDNSARALRRAMRPLIQLEAESRIRLRRQLAGQRRQIRAG